MIKLDTLELIRYNEEKHSLLKDDFEHGASFSPHIYKIGERLELSKNNKDSIYQSAFVVEDNNIPIGYVFISNMVNDEVFIEYSILKEYRRKGYGSRLVNEVSDYLFTNNNIKNVKLDIDPSNKNSVFLANSCGFYLDEEDYESRNFIGRMQFIKESDCYISKRKK